MVGRFETVWLSTMVGRFETVFIYIYIYHQLLINRRKCLALAIFVRKNRTTKTERRKQNDS